MTNITQEQERRIACLGLMATESEKAGACPADELLASFIRGKTDRQGAPGDVSSPQSLPVMLLPLVGDRFLS
jgi:hypothetical protein